MLAAPGWCDFWDGGGYQEAVDEAMGWYDPVQACRLARLVWSPTRCPHGLTRSTPPCGPPRTPEDRLIALYLAANPGLLFLEIEVGQGDENCGPRRLDGLLVRGGDSCVRAQGSYSRADITAAVQGQHVHVLEAKRKLNRTVIGQVQVGVSLFMRDFSPASVQGVAVCAFGNPDLEWYCLEQDIQMALYPMDLPKGAARVLRDGRVDRRKPPAQAVVRRS